MALWVISHSLSSFKTSSFSEPSLQSCNLGMGPYLWAPGLIKIWLIWNKSHARFTTWAPKEAGGRRGNTFVAISADAKRRRRGTEPFLCFEERRPHAADITPHTSRGVLKAVSPPPPKTAAGLDGALGEVFQACTDQLLTGISLKSLFNYPLKFKNRRFITYFELQCTYFLCFFLLLGAQCPLCQ